MRELTLERRAVARHVGASAAVHCAPVCQLWGKWMRGSRSASWRSVRAPLAALAQSDDLRVRGRAGQQVVPEHRRREGLQAPDVGPVLSFPAARLPAGRSAAPQQMSARQCRRQRSRASIARHSAPATTIGAAYSRRSSGRRRRLVRLRSEFNNGEPERRGDERNYALPGAHQRCAKTSLAGNQRRRIAPRNRAASHAVATAARADARSGSESCNEPAPLCRSCRQHPSTASICCRPQSSSWTRRRASFT